MSRALRNGSGPMSIERSPKALKAGATALPIEPLTVRIPVAVQLTGIGRSKLYELIKSGDVETVKIGTATLITMASLRRLVERGSA
jgi:hypothetical protein